MNLGFLSTSKSIEIANEFKENLLMIIKIQDKQRCSQVDYGYADISQNSFIQKEEEILFNPFNTFMIEDFQEMPNLVVLNYGTLAETRLKRRMQLTSKQQSYAAQIEYLLEESKESLKHQGDAFISDYDCIDGGFEYWT